MYYQSQLNRFWLTYIWKPDVVLLVCFMLMNRLF